MTVAAVPRKRPPPEGPPPPLQHACHMSSGELSAVIAPCFTQIQKPAPWPPVPLEDPHQAHEWLEYIMCLTGDLLNDRCAAWSWDSLDLPVDMQNFIASCWTDGTKKSMLLFVGNPARLSDEVWNDYKALRILPKASGERPLTPAETIYHRISEICKKNDATLFAITSYTTWSFGIFDHSGGACRVSAPLRPLDCSSVLLAWLYSASGCEGAIQPWDYNVHEVQRQLQAEISTQYAEFERLAYEQARENSVKLADESERFERARRHEQARSELVRSHEQRQQNIKARLHNYLDKQWLGGMCETMGIPEVDAKTPSVRGDLHSFGDDESAATPRDLSDSIAPSPSAAGEGSVYIDLAPFTPRMTPGRMPPPRPVPGDGLSTMTPTVPNSSIRDGHSSSSPLTPSSLSASSSTSPGSDWHGMETQQDSPPRVARQHHHAPSSSVDSVEDILASNPRVQSAMTNLASTCGWDSEIQSKFVHHVEQIGVFPVRDSHAPAFGAGAGGDGCGPMNNMQMDQNLLNFAPQGYGMSMDSAGPSYAGNVQWDVQCGTYPPSDYLDQTQFQYYPTNVDGWVPQGDYGAMGSQVPFVNNGY